MIGSWWKGGWAQLRALRVELARRLRPARAGSSERARVGGGLDPIDDEFHSTYDALRFDRSNDVPIWVVLADELVCFQREQRVAYPITPRSYQLLKKAAHVPLALFVAAHTDGEQREREDALGRREQLLAWIRTSLEDLRSERSLDAAAKRDATTVIEASEACLRSSNLTTRAQADALARELGPVLLRMIKRASELQLEALDTATEQALQLLAVADRARLQVVVTGNHQARERSLPMQYFRARFREPADSERQVSYAEGVTSEEDALAVVGTRRIDMAIAKGFFADERRMQRDLLGDAALELLTARPPTPIV